MKETGFYDKYLQRWYAYREHCSNGDEGVECMHASRRAGER